MPSERVGHRCVEIGALLQSEAYWQIDIRDVHESVPTHFAPLKYATDGGLLEWRFSDSPTRQCAVSTSAPKRRTPVCTFFILNDSIQLERASSGSYRFGCGEYTVHD